MELGVRRELFEDAYDVFQVKYESGVSNEAKHPDIPGMPSSALEARADSVGLILGPPISTQSDRHKVLYFLYYRHLNGTALKILLSTDLITHRVLIKSGTKPASNIV